MFILLFNFLYFCLCLWHMENLGPTPHRSCNQSYNSENATSLARWATTEFLFMFIYFFTTFVFFFFGCAWGVWKFPGHRLNLCHSSDPSCCSDNTRSLTSWATRELPFLCLFWLEMYFVIVVVVGRVLLVTIVWLRFLFFFKIIVDLTWNIFDM